MEFFFGGGTLWRGKRGARSRPENYGGKGGGLRRGEGKREGRGRGRALGTTGVGDCLGLFSIVYCF